MLAILDNIPGLVFSTDQHGNIQLHRGLSLRGEGDTPGNLVGLSAFDAFQDVPVILDGLRRSLAGERVTHELEIGGEILESTLHPRRGPAGEIIGIVGVSVDITARKRAEEAYRRTSETLEAAIRSSPIAMAILDLEGRITLWNPAAEQIYGWTKEEVLGQAISFFPLTLQSRVVQKGGIAGHEQVCRHKNGSPIVSNLSGAPLHGANGEITGVLYLLLDVTARKQTEAKLEEATRSADEANRAKSKFLANLSHEIRTPMNGVLGMLDLTLDTTLTLEQQEYLRAARMSARSLLSILNDLLDFSRIETRKLALEDTDFDLLSVLEDVGTMMAVGAAGKGLELIFDVDESVPTSLRGDWARIRQVLLNLVGNAVKFTNAGEVSVCVGASRETAATVALRFEVADTGIGITADRAEAIFLPFTQAEAGPTRKYGGTGLGLTICRELAALMHGEIGVDSSEGHGSTVWFTVECQKQGLDNRQPRSEPPFAGHPKAIVVDGHQHSRNVTATLLRRLGCPVGEAANWESAEKLLRESVAEKQPYGVAFIDARIASDRSKAFAETVIVLMTHLGDPAQTRDPELTVTALIMKPIFQRPLEDILNGIGNRSLAFRPLPEEPAGTFNLKAMLERLMGDQDLAGSVIDGFLEDVPGQVLNLLRMLEAGDARGAERQAHSIRGASGVLSAERLSDTAQQIEIRARAGNIAEAAAFTSELEERLKELTSVLERSGLGSAGRLQI